MQGVKCKHWWHVEVLGLLTSPSSARRDALQPASEDSADVAEVPRVAGNVNEDASAVDAAFGAPPMLTC
jgi:hypothetical protein